MNHEFRKGLLLCLIATVSWGIMFPVMAGALKHVDPYTFTSLRFVPAALIFALVLWWREGPKAFDPRGERVWLAWIMGSVGLVGFSFLVFLGQKLAGSDGSLIAATIAATMPLIGVGVSWLARGVKPRPMSLLFIALSFVGVIVVISKGHPANLLAAKDQLSADGLILIGATCWVVYTIGASYFPNWSPLRYTTATTVLGLISVLVLNGLFLAGGLIALPSSADLVFVIPHIAYMTLGAGVIGILAWHQGNRIVTPANGVLFMNFVPIAAFAVSMLQGVTLAPAQIIGALITCGALVMNSLYAKSIGPAQDCLAADPAPKARLH
ncbi:MAG TPA: DMT family transporter [Burkholderiales bacterium]